MSEASPDWNHREFPLTNGGYVHVASRPGEGQPIVLLHGDLSTWESWQPVVAAQSAPFAGRPLIAIDLPGHGKSATPGISPSLANATQATIEALDALQAWPVTLIGDRAGALVAMELARRHPAAVSDLVLIEPPLPGPEQGVETDSFWETETDLLNWLDILRSQPLAVRTTSLQQIFGLDSVEAAELAAMQLATVSDDVISYLMAGAADRTDLMSHFDPDARPVLLLRGDDPNSTGLAQAGIGQLQNAWLNLTTQTVAGGGHDLLRSQPLAVANALQHWLD